ncbi:MAG TPA: acyl-CoA dehydrogenase [Mycobacteriales bacterium]|nr:acyl-CoA dehydrogenase [Mycobacteriales bacterium]
MFFLPSEDQLDLQRGVRELLAARLPLDRLEDGFDPALWRELTETGVFGLRCDLGLGLTEAALVFEELGRAAVPGPTVGTFLAAGVAEGPVSVLDPHQQPLLVSDLDVCAAILVLDPAGPRVIAPVVGTALAEPLDPLTPLHELAEVPPEVGTRLDVPIDRVRLEGALLTAALSVGLAARLTELAVDYAKQREQFGRPIGSFQAVKHLCADMFVRTELARASLHSAAVMLDDPQAGSAPRAVAGAKQLADEAATTNGRSAVQIHGGMGFTWEVPVHFLLTRAWMLATDFGTADEHAEDLAALL